MLLLISSKIGEEVARAILFGSCAIGLFVLYASGKLFDLFSIALYPVTWLRKRLNAWRFLIDAPDMIMDGYAKANGKPYVIHSPDWAHTFVSSKKLIEEIGAAPDSVLSLQAAAKELLQPQYSMHGFNWFDERGADGIPLLRTLRGRLTSNLPHFLPQTRIGNAAIFDEMFSEATKKPCVNDMILEAVAHTNALAFFGNDLVHNKPFLKATLDFVVKTIVIAEIVRILPVSISPMVGRYLSRKFNAHKIIHETLEPVAEQRLAERELKQLGHKVPEHKDCIQWLMEQSSKTNPWAADRIVHELMALWFGSVHSMAMSVIFAIHDLSMHPEYLQPLREEFEGPAYKSFEATGDGLPLLDSFLKESSRLSPLDSMSSRRKALQSFHLSDGTFIEKGHWIATPLRAMMRDPENYVQPLEFHGFRHLSPGLLEALEMSFQSPEPEKALPMTDVTEWQVWGTGRLSCPGRFYAVAGMKQIFGLIFTKYDLEMVDKEAPRSAHWRTCNVPRKSTPIVLRERVRKA